MQLRSILKTPFFKLFVIFVALLPSRDESRLTDSNATPAAGMRGRTRHGTAQAELKI